ncbi:MAG: hypothetical protein HYV17_02010 [Xanthomonadales bacterium]|nr:hypothetical protein [Xanthomonadales bacterium]
MNATDIRNAAASVVDADGVRTQPAERSGGHWRRWIGPVCAVAGLLVGLVLLSLDAAQETAVRTQPAAAVVIERDPRGVVSAVRAAQSGSLPTVKRAAPAPANDARIDASDFTVPSQDPDDLAAYFSPGDAEPTMAELIEALNDAGVREGIAAFNPPGTSPLLRGIAVPPEFQLPPGYVRHHQVTDQGEDIEPILMFAPEVQFFDEHGQPITIPEDRVVPPELAPPGLPIRSIDLPDPGP